ncbi:MAG: MFS transporter [Candidatus Paceibacterota bacterium]|jgi:MFS family permease
MLSKPEKILLYSNIIWNFGDGMFGPFFALFTQKIGGNLLDIAWAWAIYLFVTGFLIIVIGKFSDRGLNKAKLMIWGYALTAVCTFAYIFVSSPFELFIVQAILGLAIALCNPTWYALYDKYSNPIHDGYTWGLSDGVVKMFGGLAILIGGVVIKFFSFEALFVIIGVIQIISTIYQIKILRYEGKLVSVK